MRVISGISLILVLAGAINWGLWGFFQFDFISWLCGGNSTWVARVIYAVVGLGGLWGLSFLSKCKQISK